MKIAVAQINCTVGDFDGNCLKIIDYVDRARAAGAGLVSFPEMSITGYPPEDLLMKNAFVDENTASLSRIVKAVGDIIAVVGFVDRKGKNLYNAAAIIHRGRIKGVYHKIFLPNYGVFDEKRYFEHGQSPSVFRIGDAVFGVNICEDIWHKDGPTKRQAAAGSTFIVNINASPYYAGRGEEREATVRQEARRSKTCISYANLVGGQDELVFDGQSMIVGPDGQVIARAKAFEEDLIVADVGSISGGRAKTSVVRQAAQPLEPMAEIYKALVLGLRDYVKKNGFEKAVIAMSGGIDSSLVAAIAVDALGKENITGVYMPTHYSSEESGRDAREVADRLAIKLMTISIEQIFKLFLLALEPAFAGLARGIAEENIQARIRGSVVMALSNKFRWLVLTTGNKSEMSTGYATLYGDMAGGFAVIKDVPKTLVYKLVRYRNSVSEVIPESVIRKEPTAELRADQKDRDTLPPYETLDPILKAYVEEDAKIGDIIKKGFDKETVLNTVGLVDRSEYKRRQAPPGVKITPKAFGRDRRMPITNRYK